jgi:hypothetical protein
MKKNIFLQVLGFVVLISIFFMPCIELHHYEDESVRTIYGYENLYYYLSFSLLLILTILRAFWDKGKSTLFKLINFLLISILLIEFASIFLNPFQNSSSTFCLGYFVHVISILSILIIIKPKPNSQSDQVSF